MDLNDQIEFGHLLFFDRKCRVCGEIKNLLEEFYLSRKDRATFKSSYSYECKECTIKRIKENRKGYVNKSKWEYPDW